MNPSNPTTVDRQAARALALYADGSKSWQEVARELADAVQALLIQRRAHAVHLSAAQQAAKAWQTRALTARVAAATLHELTTRN